MVNLPVYLDHAATTFPDEAVIGGMAACMRAQPCNASAAYSAAGDARRVHRLARQHIAGMLSCPPQDLYFTSGGTEANNWAIRAFAGCNAAVSAMEHHSILAPARAVCRRVTTILPDRTGFISPETVAAAITPDTKLIALQWANNETGVIQPIRDVYALCKARHIHLHVDAVQAFGHIPVDAQFCDSMSLSAHKLYGPRGVGALYIRSGASILPLLLGGDQESGMRAGTENTPGVCGFDIAAQMAEDNLHTRMNRERELLDGMIRRLQSAVPEIVLLGHARERLPGVAALLLPGVSSEAVIAAMDLRGVMLSGGAACAARSGQPSHVYTAMGLSTEEAARVIRVSIGRHTTADQLEYAAEALISVIAQQAR